MSERSERLVIDKERHMKRKTIKMPPRDYQPSKAELEEEFDMPKAKIKDVRKAFFNSVKIESDK